MQDYQIVLVFDEHHDKKAINLINRLQSAGIQVLKCTQYTAVTEWEKYIKTVDFVFVLLTDDAPLPQPLVRNADNLIQKVSNRGKQLYVIKEYNAALPPDFQGYPILEPEDGTMYAPQGGGIAGMICNLVVDAQNRQMLYEKLSSMILIEYTPGIQETLADLCELLCNEFLAHSSSNGDFTDEITAILKVVEEMSNHPTAYDNQARAIAGKMNNAASKTHSVTRIFEGSKNLYCLACALHMEELTHAIWASCWDTITLGDADLYNKPLSDFYHTLSARFMVLLELAVSENKLDTAYTPEQAQFILEQAERCKNYGGATGNTSMESLFSSIVQKKQEAQESAPLNETEKKLYDIAEFMSKGYALFESMSHDKTAADFLRCLKTSFERLKNYCNIIEAKAISAQCIDYIAKIDQQLGRMPYTDCEPGKAELGLKALLGLKNPNSGQYDVFISYKHEDEDIARNVYHHLKSKLLNAFFDQVTLPELSESDYDDAIMKALENSRHFMVVITDLAQLETYWIKLEMKTFHHEMAEGRKRDSNFIILVTDQVFSQITDSNKTVLPLRYRSCEIMRISNYKDVLYRYMSK